jgi:hypothetical protein
MFSMSMAIGAIATTRVSTAAVSQLVRPRFDSPETTKRSIRWSNSCSAKLWRASMARRALFTIGNSSGHVGSLLFKY